MSHPPDSRLLLCNGASVPKGITKRAAHDAIRLEYRKEVVAEPNVRIHLPDFVRGLLHLPSRLLDLLEIAAYIFAGDRSVIRGEKDSLELHAWSRSLHFAIKVRDLEFWKSEPVTNALGRALQFMSGDREYKFTFEPGHVTAATGLFDHEGVKLPPIPDAHIALFSGGLDSLAGVIEHLQTTSEKAVLISHQSGQTGTHRTQNKLFEALGRKYPNRLTHYKFGCGLRGERAEEETQRTRAFLYASIGFVLAKALSSERLVAYENGITAINFLRRGDLYNGRASRTTHPKTIHLLNEFFANFEGSFEVETPFIWKTKSDVFALLSKHGGNDFITSSVSCSKTFRRSGVATHCGGCSQCIDRRFAAYASGTFGIDEGGIYTVDFVTQLIQDRNVLTTLIDYVRQARLFASWNIDQFQAELLPELADVIGFIDGSNEEQTVEHVYALCERHGKQVRDAIRSMRYVHDDPFNPVSPRSFLSILGDRLYLKSPQDYHSLLSAFGDVKPGKDDAHRFEALAKESLIALFDPDLTNPRAQSIMDGGRKRVDITFDNKAKQGVFAHLRDGYRKLCPYILFECKNYDEELGNHEFAQLADRLGSTTTEVGFIVCRHVQDKKAISAQCQDRYVRRGVFIVVLEDSDLQQLLAMKEYDDQQGIDGFLEGKLLDISMRV